MRVVLSNQDLGLEPKLARIRWGLYLYEMAWNMPISPARLVQFDIGHHSRATHLGVEAAGSYRYERTGGSQEKAGTLMSVVSSKADEGDKPTPSF